jgi:tetratricopeptide (TPR) repeat protein
MTLQASLLRQLENPNLTADNRADLRCEIAREFEDKGEYELAREVLDELWLGERPKIDGLEISTGAEVLLRAGVLTGQRPGAQETAKNLISESLAIFSSLNYKKKIAEAQCELALAYWRTGEYNEARDLLTETLKLLPTDSELKAKVILRLGIVELDSARTTEGLRILEGHSVLFERVNNQTIKGSYHATLGNALENRWATENQSSDLDRALIEYTAASYHFEEAEHRRYLANVENNLGFLYFKIERCQEAHDHLDRARRILARLKDKITIAQVDETRARVFLKERRNSNAERTAQSAVQTLAKSDRQSLLAEALITHGTALARLRRYSPALSAFRQAVDISQGVGCMNRAAEAALTAFQEIGERLSSDDARSLPAGRKLFEEINRFEHDLIKHALDEAQGKVTFAAQSLGISYQSLGYMLQTRHKDLLGERTPVYRRAKKDQSE